MTNRFMVSVAALALVAGTGFANAQGTWAQPDSGGAKMQQNTQPSAGTSEHGGSMSKEKGTTGQAGGASATKSNQSTEERSPGGMNRHQSTEKKAGTTTGQGTNERSQGPQQQDHSQSQYHPKGMSSGPARRRKAASSATTT